jgi:peptide/nickel transport system substrate-binding protein
MSNDQRNDYFFRQFVEGRMSRREFMGRMAATGASVALINTLVAGRASAMTPKMGGRLVVGTEGAQAADSLDPTKFYSTSNLLAGYTIYDTLVNRGPDLLPTPWLAESWDSSDDTTEWVFKLRQGVTWHNGKTFDADDVIYSFSRHIREGSESPAKSFLSQIVEMVKEDATTVRFKLAGPNADFPIVLTDTRAHITQNGFEDFQGTAPGTGPFKIKSFEPGSTYVFERNVDYWADDGPYVDEIEMVGVGDITARVNALISGDINVLLYLDPKAVGLIEASPSTEVLRAQSGAFMNVAMMVDRPPTDNNDLRLALKYAIDRQQVVDNVLKGYGSIGNDHPIAPIDPFYCDDIPQREYDPDKARFHFKQAGMEGETIDFYTSDVPAAGSVAAAQVFQQSAAAAGINLNLIQPPADTYWSAVWIQKPMSCSGWDARPVPDLILSIALKGDSSYNETQWKNERFDSLLIEARGIRDFDRRKEIYCEMQRMLHDDGGHLSMAFLDYLDAARTEVRGITPHSSGPLGFYQMARTAWIDA